MRSRSFFIVAAVLVLLLVAAGGVYAYDSGREHQIAKGISVGGVDVGGLQATDAEQRLRKSVLAKLNRPVVATYHGKHFTLTPKQARVGVDIDGSVSQALHRSRSGNIFARTSRNLRGTSLNEDLDLDISYNRAAIRKLVKRVSTTVDKPAIDAHVNLEEGDITPRPSTDGLAVRTASLKSPLRRSLLSTDGDRSVRVRTKVVKPKVTTDELAKKYPSVVIVNRGAFKLTLYKDLKPVKTLRDRGRPGRARDARRALPRAEQGGRPGLDDAELELGGAQGPRQGRPRRHGREPAEGALARDLRRRRHPRHRRRRARSAPPPPTAASACGSPT